MENLQKLWVCALLTGCAMSHEVPVGQEIELRPVGLYTDPNPHGAVPKGALKTAKNVVLRRDGLLEPRPGFERSSASLTGTDPSQLIPYDGDLLIIEKNSGTEKTDWYNSGTPTNVQDDNSSDLDWDMDHLGAAEARSNLYLATQDAVRKLTSSSDTAAEKAGAPRPYEVSLGTSGAGSVIDQWGGRAYIALIKRTDANGLVVRSPVSPASIVQHGTATSQKVDVTVRFDSNEVIGTSTAGTPGDTMEIYRTPQVVGTSSASGIPGEEYFLIDSHELTAAEASAGAYTFVDTKVDSLAGAALYTNPSQEGILQNNDRMHVAKDLALFKGSLFAANTRGPHRFSFTQLDSGVDKSGSATGVGYRDVTTGSITNGSPNYTGISAGEIAGIKVGMLIEFAAGVPAQTTVSSISGTGPYTVVMSKNATATTTPNPAKFHDVIRVKVGGVSNLEDFTYPVSRTHGWEDFIDDMNTNSFALGDGPSAYVRARFLTRPKYAAAYQANAEDTLIIEERLRGGNAFEVFATHGSEYDPILPEPDAVNGYDSAADVRPNGIQWSKPDQPEHVPEANFAVVGSEKHEILKLIPTKDALFIFKTDGIWRLTGFGAASGWRIDPIDRSTYLLTPRAAGVLSGQVFAWTNRGLVHVRQDGIDPQGGILSKLAIGNNLRDIERALAKYSTETPSAFLAINEKDDELILGVPSSAGDANTTRLYIYNTKTRSWVEWSLALTHLVNNPADNLLYGVAHATDAVTIERSGGNIDLADRDYSVTVNSVSGTTVTIAAGSGWTPGIGDLMFRSGTMVVVKAVTSATVFDIDATGLPTGAATAYDAFYSDIEFVVRTGRDPSLRKHFKTVALMFEDMIGLRRIDMEYTSNLSGSITEENRTMLRATESTQPRTEFFYVPTEHAIVTHLWPNIEIPQSGAAWVFSGMSVTYDYLSPLVHYSEDEADIVIPPS